MIQGITPIKFVNLRRAITGDLLRAATISELYSTEDDSSRWTFIATGIIFLFESDNFGRRGDPRKHLYFVLVDLHSEEVVWKHEVYRGMKLNLHKNFFISFEADNTFFGFSVAKSCSGIEFFLQVVRQINKKYGRLRKDKKIFSFFRRLFRDRDPNAPRPIVSAPRNFTHRNFTSIPLGGVYDRLGEDWKGILRDAGIHRPQIGIEDKNVMIRLLRAINRFKRDILKIGKQKKKKKQHDDMEEEYEETEGEDSSVSPFSPPPLPGDDIFAGGKMKRPKNEDLLDKIRSFKRKENNIANDVSARLDPKNLSEEHKQQLVVILRGAANDDDDDSSQLSSEEDESSESWSDEEEDDW